MTRYVPIGFLTLIAVIAGVALYLALRSVPVTAPSKTAWLAAIANPYIETSSLYDISASYPTTTPLTPNASSAALSTMQSWVIERISAFKSGGPEDVGYGRLPAGEKATLDITFEMHSSSTTISYVFGDAEFTGGDHPFVWTKMFTFDKATGMMLSTQTN